VEGFCCVKPVTGLNRYLKEDSSDSDSDDRRILKSEVITIVWDVLV
jgi:hypothetical protein